MKLSDEKIVGIVPAAGIGSRLGALPFSKELFPLGIDKGQLKVASHHLLKSMAAAGASQIHFVIRDGKWDIPGYFGSNFNKQVPIAYHLAEYGYGVPFTVNQAYPFIKDKNVLLGFPDILFKPADAFGKMTSEMERTDASILLGLFPVSRPDKFDMVEIDEENFIKKIVIKPKEGDYNYAWSLALWKPDFSVFLNQFVNEALASKTENELNDSELHFGHVIIAALASGIKAKAVIFENGKSVDIGTPEDLLTYTQYLSS